MAVNADIKDIKIGTWELYAGALRLGSLGEDDITFGINGNVIEVKNFQGGASVTKAFATGNTLTAEFTVNHLNKQIIQRLYNWFNASNLNAGDGSLGRLGISNYVGKLINSFTFTAYLIHQDDNGNSYGADANNPYSIQFTKAFVSDALNLAFSSTSVKNTKVMIKSLVDFDNPNDGWIGFNSLPAAQLLGLNYSVTGNNINTLSATFGTTWSATMPMTANQIIISGSNMYRVTVGGTGAATAPVHTSGSVASGTATLLYLGVAPSVTFTLSGGRISATNIIQAGTNVPADLTVSFTASLGAGGAAPVATVVVG
jgi:hypothetical protein